MQRILLLPFLAVALVAPAGTQETAASSAHTRIEKEVLKVEQERDQALQKLDMPTLDRLQADGLVVVTTKGQVLDKDRYMEELRSGGLKFLTLEVDDRRYHVYGDTVIVTGRASSVLEYHGNINRTPRRFTSVYVKEQGQWRLVAHQATLIAEQ
jgi:ketosteroid isomerase-like protein